MRFDTYTKLVLTVIAVCLMILCWQNFTNAPVHAQTVQPVAVVSVEGMLPVNITGFAGVELANVQHNGLPVWIQGMASDAQPLRISQGQAKH